MKRFQEEASNVRFRICEQGWGKVAFQKKSLTAYNSAEQAFLSAFPKLIAEGRYLEDILNIIGVLDQRIADEGIRLRDEAQGRNIALRSGLFANSYVFQTSSAPGITWILFSTKYRILFRDHERQNVEDHRKTFGSRRPIPWANSTCFWYWAVVMASRHHSLSAPSRCTGSVPPIISGWP